jgi:hypothetical protein
MPAVAQLNASPGTYLRHVTTWARDPATLDLVFPTIGGGEVALVTDPNAECAIKLRDRFRLWLGEWFLDTRQGFPWLDILGQKQPDLVAVKQLIRKALLQTPTVANVDDVSVDFERATRTLSYAFTVHTTGGAQITGGSGQPFIVSTP